MASVALSLGLTNKLSLTGSLPIIINRSVNKSLDQTDLDFGGLSVMGRAFFSPRLLSKPANIQVAIGASFPVGAGISNVITDERNFASGTIDPIGSVILAIGITPDWNATTKFFTRQVIATSSDGQRTGDHYAYSMETVYAPLGRSYTANAGIAIINRGQDIIDGNPFPNSGGDWIYAKIGGTKTLIGTGETAVRFWSEFQLPVYLYVKGVQLTEKWNLRFGLSAGISLFGHSKKTGNLGPFGGPTSDN